MAETYIVKLRKDAAETYFTQVAAFMKSKGGQVILAFSKGNWLIANLDPELAQGLKKIPQIAAVGGVTLKKREVKHIRRVMKE